MRRTTKQVIAFFLTLVLMLSLCACGQKPQTGIVGPDVSAGGGSRPDTTDKKKPEKLRPVSGAPSEHPVQTGFSQEAEQSLGSV